MSNVVASSLPLAFCATIVRDAHADATVVALAGEIDLFVADVLDDALTTALDDGLGILVDLSACSFFGSTGLNALAKAERETRRRQTGFAVVAPPGGACRFVLDLALRDGPGLFDDHPGALQALRTAAQDAGVQPARSR